MQVDLIARTQLAWNGILAMEDAGYVFHDHENDADELAEFAGRLCYLSWRRPNPKTATNKGYISNILEHVHFSTIEHVSMTFLFSGVSRSLTHELVRHRHFSYSQLSQRYCDQSEAKMANHPLFATLDMQTQYMIKDHESASQQLYVQMRDELVAKGKTKKEANGVARQVLPEGTETAILVSGNLRSWMEFIDKRYSVYADEEIRLLAELVLKIAKDVAPNVFQNFELKDFTQEVGVTK